jgi:hypothetical protein
MKCIIHISLPVNSLGYLLPRIVVPDEQKWVFELKMLIRFDGVRPSPSNLQDPPSIQLLFHIWKRQYLPKVLPPQDKTKATARKIQVMQICGIRLYATFPGEYPSHD